MIRAAIVTLLSFLLSMIFALTLRFHFSHGCKAELAGHSAAEVSFVISGRQNFFLSAEGILIAITLIISFSIMNVVQGIDGGKKILMASLTSICGISLASIVGGHQWFIVPTLLMSWLTLVLHKKCFEKKPWTNWTWGGRLFLCFWLLVFWGYGIYGLVRPPSTGLFG